MGVDESTGRKRVCAFIVDRDLPGVSVHPVSNKFGFRPVKTGELVLEDVRVPASALVGEEGRGFGVAMNAVENGRLGVAARATGLAQACVDVMVEYARDRRSCSASQSPASRWSIQKMIADSATDHCHRRGPAARVAVGRSQGSRPARAGGGVDGQAVRERRRDGRGAGRVPDPRCLRCVRRVSGRALPARRQGLPDRRRQQRAAPVADRRERHRPTLPAIAVRAGRRRTEGRSARIDSISAIRSRNRQRRSAPRTSVSQ